MSNLLNPVSFTDDDADLRRLLDMLAYHNPKVIYGNTEQGRAAYKLFEEQDDQPKSLVHGLPGGYRRSRIFPVDRWIGAERGKPGFNCFDDPVDLLCYYPRFRVRAPRLVACKVHVNDPYILRTKCNYQQYGTLIIYEEDWVDRIVPYSLDINPRHQKTFQSWLNAYAQQVQST
jgi:hypothetical protein